MRSLTYPHSEPEIIQSSNEVGRFRRSFCLGEFLSMARLAFNACVVVFRQMPETFATLSISSTKAVEGYIRASGYRVVSAIGIDPIGSK
jgi:hypothetical protein